MQLSILTLLILLVFLILVSGFFSGSEIGMMSLNRYRLKHLVKQKNKKAIRVYHLLNRPDRLLSVILIGNTFANIIASMLATLLGQRLYGDAGVAIAAILLTFIILVVSEMAPKTLAALYPQKVAFFASLPLLFLQKLFSPMVKLTTWIANNLLRLFGVKLDAVQKEALTNEELRSVVHEAGGFLPSEHKGMLISLLDLEQARVEDIMVPKSEIVGIDIEQPWDEILEQLETVQHTRVPLYRNTIDNLVGLIHLRKVLNLMLEENLDLESLLNSAESPYFIPEATPLNIQILNFQKMKRRSCFVVDEYGDLQGLVTTEDILEEVVGEFTTDMAAMSKDIIHQDDGSVIVDASITVRNLNRLMQWQLPLMGPRTLSGMIIEYLGYIPPAESCLRIEHFHIEILKVGENTIKSVSIIKKM